MRERPSSTIPTRFDAVVFRAKAAVFQAERAARDAAAGPRRHRRCAALAGARVLAESVTPLWYAASASERALEAGKVHNLRVAARALDGVEVPAGETFGFWAQLGRLTRARGYVLGRELREGCVVPAIGGGICQLSNALFDAADRAGLEIVERHRHSRVVAGSLAEVDRDATVFWNYVDLRFRSRSAFRLEVTLTRDALVVRVRAASALVRRPSLTVRRDEPAAHDCATCGEASCFRKGELPAAGERFGRTAFLVDDVWPEHDAYVRASRVPGDVLALPIDGAARGRARYAWSTDGVRDVRQAVVATVRRSLESRRLAAQGAERQRALLAGDERLAAAHARALGPDVVHVVVAQTLLPFLWRDGHLGGRTFDVLMTRLPLGDLHEHLDRARAAHPESPTLGDFRADERLVRDELEALRHARLVVTPHAEIARRFGDRACRTAWHEPSARASIERGALVAFAGPTAGRSGAYEVREVARALGVRLAVAGSMLEGETFWDGVAHERRGASDDWLRGAAVVVAPSWVEHRPRRLLEAVARGVPVVASTACGLAGVAGVVEVPTGDVDALRDAVAAIVGAGCRISATCRPSVPSPPRDTSRPSAKEDLCLPSSRPTTTVSTS